MKTLVHSLILLAAVVLAYLCLALPQLHAYALQAFAGSLLLFFLVKRLKKAKIWHVLPEEASAELAILTFGVLLLIGGTGNLNSWFFSLGFIHLFFLVLTSEVVTAVVVTMAIVVFHLLLAPQVGQAELVHLANLPLFLLFFLFAKEQYDEALVARQVVQQEAQEVATLQQTVADLETKLDQAQSQ